MQSIEISGRISAANMGTSRTLVFLTAGTGDCGLVTSVELMNESATVNAQFAVDFRKVTTLGAPVGTAADANRLSGRDETHGLANLLVNLTTEPTTYAAARPMQLAGPSLGGIKWYAQPDLSDAFLIRPSESWGLYLATVPATTFICVARVVLRLF